MRPGLTTACLIGCAVLLAGCSTPEEDGLYQEINTGDASLVPLTDLARIDFGPLVVGGRLATAKDWPASFQSIAQAGNSTSNSTCTATLVGPRALLTAAHCVGNGRTITLQEKQGDTRVDIARGTCTHAEYYLADSSADYALCLLEAPLNRQPYETVNRDPTILQRQMKVLLAGYGCTDKYGTSGTDVGFRIGDASITTLPASSGKQKNYILTSGENFVCPGDSGGGAYILQEPIDRRLLIAVNSAVGSVRQSDGRKRFQNPSYLSATSTQNAQAFFNKWASDPKNKEKNDGKDVVICGVNLHTHPCR